MIWSYLRSLCKNMIVNKEEAEVNVDEFIEEAHHIPVGASILKSNVPEFVENENVVLSIYKDGEGNMYVGLNDRVQPEKKIVLTAEAVFKVTEIVNKVFDSKSTGKVAGTLN